MCGIAGIVEGIGEPSIAALRSMQHALVHRGPNDDGVHADGSVAMAHTRLSIIDLEGGHQPLFSRSRDVCLVVNGEIYNYKELRDRYVRDGYVFSTHSDCEVILPLYEQYGDACVDHLRGMFAFSLWDRAKRRLLLARDRMGEKPLYYYCSGRRLVFASELRSMLASGLVPAELLDQSIAQYFRYQYVPEPATPFVDIKKLGAGCILTVDIDDWKVNEMRYWSAWSAPELDADPKTAIRASLEDAVATSLVSDVPIGLSLSGGIDSSILACLMRKYSDREIHAIAIGYKDAAGVDERSEARQLAKRLGLIFHDVELEDQRMLDRFAEVVAARDDPIGDISGYNYFSIMEHARDQGIPVMFQGHGADELCWGYPWVKDAVARNELSRDVGASDRCWTSPRWWAAQARACLRSPQVQDYRAPFQMFELQPYTNWVMKNGEQLFTDSFRRRSGVSSRSIESDYGDSGLRVDLEVTRLIVEFYLQENGIAQGDRLSMANSVEMRLPFVDYRFVETIIGLRKRHRDDHLPLKHWLKESVKDMLPEEVLNRPKRGFSPPVVRWQEQLRKRYGHLLKDGLLVSHGILNASYAERLAEERIADAAESIVSRLAITLEIWVRKVIANEAI